MANEHGFWLTNGNALPLAALFGQLPVFVGEGKVDGGHDVCRAGKKVNPFP